MTWLTRREAAAYLKVSIRQLDRLKLPRSYVGSRIPRYAEHTLEAFLRQHQVSPQTTRGRPGRRPRRRPGLPALTDAEGLEIIKKW